MFAAKVKEYALDGTDPVGSLIPSVTREDVFGTAADATEVDEREVEVGEQNQSSGKRPSGDIVQETVR